MDTNLSGRLRNTHLPKAHGLLPLFEAVINSIHSIEERGLAPGDGFIRIKIHREAMLPNLSRLSRQPDAEELPRIESFEITDNGIGFNATNFQSFETLDSEHKGLQGGRGIGRLLWLKAFSSVAIESTFENSAGKGAGVRQKRTFCFSGGGICDENVVDLPPSAKLQTTIRLNGFIEAYRKSSAKKLETISNALLDHCLKYFIRKGGLPDIILTDNNRSCELIKLYEKKMVNEAKHEKILLKGKVFELIHVKVFSIASRNTISYCAATRTVKSESLNSRLPGLHGKIVEGEREFYYQCFVSSGYLDEKVRPERTGFDILEENEPGLLAEELSFSQIRGKVLESSKEYLRDALLSSISAGKNRIQEFVDTQRPRYKPIIGKLSEDEKAIDPNMSSRELDVYLHRKLAERENVVLAEGKRLLESPIDGNIQEYEKLLQAYLLNADEIRQAKLADYVCHRKVVLDLLKKAMEQNTVGEYAKEKLVHRLIMPMGIDSNAEDYIKSNLWLVDERLAFHDYLASDKKLDNIPITGSKSSKRPDLLALNIFDNPLLVSDTDRLPLASITVLEFKRPMRNDAGEDKNPIEQALRYLANIRQGKLQTASGRQIPESSFIPGFCYILADLTESMRHRSELAGLQVTADKMGYFGYNGNFNAYIEVISFDRLLNAARERNQAFFDKLGLPL